MTGKLDRKALKAQLVVMEEEQQKLQEAKSAERKTANHPPEEVIRLAFAEILGLDDARCATFATWFFGL